MNKLKKYKWSVTGIRYAVTLVFVIGLILLGAIFFHVADPTWALISGVICTELDMNRTNRVVAQRILLTLVGVVLSLIILFLLGPGYSNLLVGVVLVTLVCYYLVPVNDGWKFATATAMVVLVVASQKHSIASAEMMAFKRAIEVTAGSIIAGGVSIVSDKLWQLIKKKY